MTKTVYDVIRDMVLTAPKPAKALAEELGKPYSTFMREINADDSGAKLGVEMLVPLMLACDSIMPLRYLASRMHCRVVSMRGVVPDKPSLLEELLDTYPALSEYHRAIMGKASLEDVAKLKEEVIRQVQEDYVAYATSNKADAGLVSTGGPEGR